MNLVIFKVSNISGEATARAVLQIWLMRDNATVALQGDESVELWEKGFIEATVGERGQGSGNVFMPLGLRVYALAERSYYDEISYVVNSNIFLLLSGFLLLFIYVALVLGNFNISGNLPFQGICGVDE